jgi:5-(aminomethyl)-3-furanmethanol phosphate kinase
VAVVKVGGSLLVWPEFPERMRRFLDGLATPRVVLIVGGGKAADFIRELDSLHGIGDNRAHALAVRMLDVTARVVAALVPGVELVERPEALVAVWERGRIPVLAPSWLLETVDAWHDEPLPASWDVSTDSIAARAAIWLEIPSLLLVKSTGPSESIGRLEAARRGLVDPYFPHAAAPLVRVELVNLRSKNFDSFELIDDTR